MRINMDKDIFQITVNDAKPLTEDDFDEWDKLFRTWKKAQNSRCRKIIRKNYDSDADFIKDVEDLTKNKHFHEALITIHQKLVANFIEEIKPYWTVFEKDKNSVIALLCTKYGLDIDQAKSLFECPIQHYLKHLWGLKIPGTSADTALSRAGEIVWLLTRGEDTLFDRLYRLPTPKDTDTEKRQEKNDV